MKKNAAFVFAAALALNAGARTVHGLDNGLVRKPPLGWMSWMYYTTDITESIIKGVADELVNGGYRVSQGQGARPSSTSFLVSCRSDPCYADVKLDAYVQCYNNEMYQRRTLDTSTCASMMAGALPVTRQRTS